MPPPLPAAPGSRAAAHTNVHASGGETTVASSPGHDKAHRPRIAFFAFHIPAGVENIAMRIPSIGLVISSLVLTAACNRAPAPAAQPAAPAPAADGTGKAGPGGSELIAGLGDVHHPINTTNPDAQKFFDQGMALAFGFNHEAAIRSFERAQQLDPKARDAVLGRGVGAWHQLQHAGGR